jgi:hypothetical protein
VRWTIIIIGYVAGGAGDSVLACEKKKLSDSEPSKRASEPRSHEGHEARNVGWEVQDRQDDQASEDRVAFNP